MSLEMVIGLLILLVVAAVVINLFLGNIKGITGVKEYQSDIDFRKFKSECESYCKEGTDGSMVAYCSQKLKKTDLNGNKIVDILQSSTSVLKMCEDAIYCFLIAPCERETGNVGPTQCRQILCKAWNDIYDDPAKSTCKVNELILDYGTCKLKSDENWYFIGGFKDEKTGKKEPCGVVCSTR